MIEMGCFHYVSPSPATFSVAQQPAAVATSYRAAVRRRAQSLCSPSPPRLLQMVEGPRPPRLLAIRARKHVGSGGGGGDRRPLPAGVRLYLKMAKRPHNFPKEDGHITSHLSKLNRVFDGLLHYVAGGNTRCLCGLAANAVAMASFLVDNASLNNNAPTPGEISRDTVHRTLGAYVQIFVQTADDAFNNTVNKETITSFLGALRGMASVAHILLQAALEGLAHQHPKESLSEYAFNYDVKKMQHVYDRRMCQLEGDIRKSPVELHTCMILMPTISEAMEATESFVLLLMTRRERTLGKTNS